MPMLVNSVDLDARVEAVFDYEGELQDELEWNRGRVTYVKRPFPLVLRSVTPATPRRRQG